MGRRQPKPTRLSEAVRRLKQELKREDIEIGRALDVSDKVINNKLTGWQMLDPEEADAILEFLGLPPGALEVSLFFGDWLQSAKPPEQPLTPEQEDERHCLRNAGLLGLHVAKAVHPVLLQEIKAKRIARDRCRAAELGPLLLNLATAQERRDRIKDAEDYQTWALVEWLALASERAAADKPARALELAELALYTVPFVPGPAYRRARLEGWASFHLANALRVKNDHDGADAAVDRGWDSWRAGAEDDFLPFGEDRLLDFEASLRRDERRFDEALDLLERALEISPNENKGRILLKKGFTLEQKGDIEAAVAALSQARPYVEESGVPRDLLVLLFNLTSGVLHLGRLSEAAGLLPDVRAAAVALGNELDVHRSAWLEARLDAAQGKGPEAIAALGQVFGIFVALELPYDAALAGLDLATLYLQQGRTRDVLPLALQMETVFRIKKVDREAMAALLLFCEAARREEATAELARHTAEVIEKAQIGKAIPPLPDEEKRGAGRSAG